MPSVGAREQLFTSEACNTANLALDAAKSVSMSSCSLLLLSCCSSSSMPCLSFKTAARAMSAALSASALILAEEVVLTLLMPLFRLEQLHFYSRRVIRSRNGNHSLL